MSSALTRKAIQLLCGRTAYDKGEALNRSGKVVFTYHDPVLQSVEATVDDRENYLVKVSVLSGGGINAECTCPSLPSFRQSCKHTAAVLLKLLDSSRIDKDFPGAALLERSSEGRSESTAAPSGLPEARQAEEAPPYDTELTSSMLGLFGGSTRPGSTRFTRDERETLELEILIRPFAYGFRKVMFAAELKIGPKRVYIVQKIRDFLEGLDRGEAYEFSRVFTYEPNVHGFRREHDEVLRQFVKIYQNENLYRETGYSSATSAKAFPGGERMLPIPPFSWTALQPLLAHAPGVKLELADGVYDGLRVSGEPLPLQFDFDRSETDGYRMDVQGLDRITVMETYGIVLHKGELLELPAHHCKRLSELKRLMETAHRNRLTITPGQMEPFMEKVVPGLMKLGKVRIAPSVSDRIYQTPLKAKLYLDRVRDRLLAGLEFHYGSVVLNPLEEGGRQRGTDHIVMRDTEKEEAIIRLMEQNSFAKTEGGYFWDDEEAEYDFLYHTVPLLERMLDIYATSAVKERLYTGFPPQITVEVDERTDWLEFKFELLGLPEAEIRNLIRSMQIKRKYHRLPNGSLVPLESAEFQEIIALMNEAGAGKGDMTDTGFRIPVNRGLHLTDARERGSSVKLGKSFRRLLENMRNPDNLDFPVPERLSPTLRDYQKFGYQWMKTLAHYHFGGILADDMGLGKTIQSIAFLVSVLPDIRKKKLPALIVSPASLVYNWLHELKKFAPEIRVVIADGTKTQRSRALRKGSKADVVLTSYPLLRRDTDLYAKESFHTLILDEAQMFKNYTTQTAQSVKQIKAAYRFALTGTPVENKLEELWSIFDAVFPGLFPARQAFNELSREAVARRARPFLLRRLKTDVLKELPDKIETVQASELLPEQKKLYTAFLAKLRHETLKHLHEESFQQNRIRILAGLTRLRQICCHPALFVDGYEGSSAKFEQLLEIVEECRSAGKRMLIFSQFTEMLGLISRELGYEGVPHFYLDGKTKGSERVELCSRFNEGEKEVFLISLKAGGTGLNLTGADTVILYDLWWNPAVEQQAADRAYRMGQKKVVQVIRLVSQGTVEEKMFQLQQKKRTLIEEVIRPGEESVSTMTEQEIRDILMLDEKMEIGEIGD
ncbi:SNF2 helicase associated domain-containing protein [Paenibacillus chitinolyticus]|uniref:SNF2 helicase associated domain-containing protein n=1 Tax=Paenibacillus chitinolyticus TaxID=79263 RepID=UPI0036733FD2